MIFHRRISRSGYMMLSAAMLTVVAGSFSEEVYSQIARFVARDPGVRTGSNGAGEMLSGLTGLEPKVFATGKEQFEEVQSVLGGTLDGEETELGLGPRFNLDSCAGCHAFPATGGTSPAVSQSTGGSGQEGWGDQ